MAMGGPAATLACSTSGTDCPFRKTQPPVQRVACCTGGHWRCKRECYSTIFLAVWITKSG